MLGDLVNGGSEAGKKIRATFLAECPCIPVLIEWSQEHAGRYGWLPGLDGRRLIMRRDRSGNVMVHKSLNTLLQSAGSITMKYSMLFLYDWNKRDNLKSAQVIMMHDEFQFSCPLEELDQLKHNIDNCVRVAGEYLKMECPLASDSMVGRSWVHTH